MAMTLIFQPANWMRLRSDLGTYLDEIKERGAQDSDLSRMVRLHFQGGDKEDIFDQLVAKGNEVENMRQNHAHLLANYQKLRVDHQKLIGESIVVLKIS